LLSTWESEQLEVKIQGVQEKKMNKALSIFIIFVSVYALWLFVLSLGGHPPTTKIGLAIIPVTLMSSIIGFFIAGWLWKRKIENRDKKE